MSKLHQLRLDFLSGAIDQQEFTLQALTGVKKAGAIYTYINRHSDVRQKLGYPELNLKYALHLLAHKIEQKRVCRTCRKLFEKYPKHPLHEPSTTCSRRCTNLDRHGELTPFSRPEVQAKKKQTVLQRYGVQNVFQDLTIKRRAHVTLFERYGGIGSGSSLTSEKIKKTNLERYGVEYSIAAGRTRGQIKRSFLASYGAESALLNLDVQKRAQGTRSDRYGSSNPFLAPGAAEKALFTRRTNDLAQLPAHLLAGEFELLSRDPDATFTATGIGKVKLRHTRCGYVGTYAASCYGIRKNCRRCTISRPQQEILDYLKTLVTQEITVNDRKILKGREIDLLLSHISLGIEVNGIYWHRDRTEEPSLGHKLKTDLCAERGITLLHIFDFEWDAKREVVCSLIKHKLGQSERIYARKLSLRELNPGEALKFFQRAHLQGHLPAATYLGLVDSTGEVAQALSLGRPRFSKRDGFIEIYRSATRLDTVVIGGFNRLVKRAKELIGGYRLMSYVDRRYFTGASYHEAGFNLEKITSPNYWYVRGSMVLSRLSAQKHKLGKLLGAEFDPELTEYENMKNAGFFKISDSGHLRFVTT